MALRSETITLINQLAKKIEEERSKKAAKEELAIVRHETRKANIRQELADLNLQLAGNPDLKRNLSEVLRAKNGYQTFKEVDEIGLCIGLPISRTTGQIALMTENGIQILERNQRARYNSVSGHNVVDCFTPLTLDKANVDGLFPKRQFKVGQLADGIARIVLQAPNKE